MSCVLVKVATINKRSADAGGIAGAAIGGAAGGFGGYKLGQFLKAGEAAKLLMAAAGAAAGGYGGYSLTKDNEGVGRPWYERNRGDLFRLIGGAGGAGLGYLGSKAFGADNPTANIGAAVLLGGLGAIGGDIKIGRAHV